MTIRRAFVGAALALFCLVRAASAQGLQTATITGVVHDQANLVVPGVTVTAASPALQGTRSAVSDGNGVYVIPAVPPGQYSVRFELAGMRTTEAAVLVALGQPSRLDATIQIAGVSETVDVIAEKASMLGTTQGSAHYRADQIGKLATARTIAGIAELAPGLTDNTPNARQVTIAGGFAYDTQFLADGVDIADNLVAQPNDLFIEDAIAEVQVLSSGISAEYGRFGGGVVNTITKSGGNDVSGTGRVNFYSPSWTTETPLEKTAGTVRPKDLQQNYEGTVGGPLLRDRLWFFGAGRWQKATTPAPLPETGLPFSMVSKNRRYEMKFTGTLVQNHVLQGSYLSNDTRTVQTGVPNLSIDPRTVLEAKVPNNLAIVSYQGVLAQKMFATLQASRRLYRREAGGTETGIVRSPFRSRGVASGVPADRFYNAPFFDLADPEERNNRQVTGSLNWLLASPRFGSHDVKAGFENYVTSRTGGNSQSATGFVFRADYLVAGGRPQLDAQDRLIPAFVPGVTRLEAYRALRNGRIDITTNSLYVQDRLTAGPRLSFDLGTRLEVVGSEATGGIAALDTATIVPRLGASYDITGGGRWVAQATYAHYAGKYSEAQFARNTNVGVADEIDYQYSGPAGQGFDFAPGFDLANYSTVLGGNFPTGNVFLDPGIHSPLTKELTFSLGAPIGGRGTMKATYQWRTINGFVEDFIADPTAAGRVTVVRDGRTFGTFDRIVYRNTDGPVRDYQALVLQGNQRLTSRWSVDGHWTVQLRNNGNFEGEAASQPGIPTLFGDYPEMYVLARNSPEGRLDDFQRHKVRLWTLYDLGLARWGAVNLGMMYRYDSPLTFSLVANGVAMSAIQNARDPGYAVPPRSQPLYFGERGSQHFEASHLVDLSATYGVPVFRDLQPWIKVELFNAFNDQSLVGFNTQVTANASGTLDADGLPTQFARGARFGQATANTHFPRSAQNFAGQSLNARTFLLSTGVRF